MKKLSWYITIHNIEPKVFTYSFLIFTCDNNKLRQNKYIDINDGFCKNIHVSIIKKFINYFVW